MTYLNSDKIQVFPFGTTRSSQTHGRVLNEQNIRSLIDNLVDFHNYVISYDITNKVIEFVISGYYFRADFSNNKDISLSGNLWAYVTLGSAADSGYTYLTGADDDNDKFTGVRFSNNQDNITANTIELQLLSDGKLISSNLFKFDGNVIRYKDKKSVTESIDSLVTDVNSIKAINIIYCGNAETLKNS